MNTDEIIRWSIEFTTQYAWQIAVLATVVVLVLILLRGRIKQAWLDRKQRRVLNRLGIKQLAHFKCADGLGGYFDIDRLVLRQDGISLIIVMRYPGSIFCADNIDEWTQMLEGKSYRFENPLVALDYQIKAFSDHVPGVAVDGYLFFDHRASFPKGHPARVITLDAIPDALQKIKKQKAEASVAAAWDRVKVPAKH
jgi:hypothetical protein